MRSILLTSSDSTGTVAAAADHPVVTFLLAQLFDGQSLDVTGSGGLLLTCLALLVRAGWRWG